MPKYNSYFDNDGDFVNKRDRDYSSYDDEDFRSRESRREAPTKRLRDKARQNRRDSKESFLR